MITPADIFPRILLRLRDGGKDKVSDQELLSAFNIVLDYILDAARLSDSPMLRRTEELAFNSATEIWEWPSDFGSVISVEAGSTPLTPRSEVQPGGYVPERDGIKLYSAADSVTLTYIRDIEPAAEKDEEIDLPSTLRLGFLEAMMAFFSGKDTSVPTLTRQAVAKLNHSYMSQVRLPDSFRG